MEHSFPFPLNNLSFKYHKQCVKGQIHFDSIVDAICMPLTSAPWTGQVVNVKERDLCK